jgi:hypothetical protein
VADAPAIGDVVVAGPEAPPAAFEEKRATVEAVEDSRMSFGPVDVVAATPPARSGFGPARPGVSSPSDHQAAPTATATMPTRVPSSRMTTRGCTSPCGARW